MTVTAAQIRAGRGLVHWTAKDLADRIGITPSSMSAIENEQSKGSVQTLLSIEAALTGAGVEFIGNDGVRKKQASVVLLEGTEGFREFMTDVFETARDIGGDICLHNARPSYWIKWLGEDWYKKHSERMTKIKDNFTLRITAIQGDANLIASSFAEYRWIPPEMFFDRSFYAYGPKLAFLNFEPEKLQIFILNQAEIADGFRGMFNITWDHVACRPEDKRA